MNIHWRLWVLIVPALLLLSGSVTAGPDLPSAQEQFFEANRAYKDDRYSAAVEGYRKLVDDGYVSGHIYYNLGNAFFRLGEVGQAILFYERARLLIPRDDDLLFNLAHARSQTVDATGDVQSLGLNVFVGLDSLNVVEVFRVFSVINILFFAVLSVRLFNKAEWSFYLSILLSILITIGGCALVLKWYGDTPITGLSFWRMRSRFGQAPTPLIQCCSRYIWERLSIMNDQKTAGPW